MASLLNNASLLLNPAGSIIAYEEDKIFSVLPSNGAGDFTFSGGDGGTRVNQDGYIERTPVNLLLSSEFFSSLIWNYEGGSISGGFTDPLGGNTAYKYIPVGGAGLWSNVRMPEAGQITLSWWGKSVSGADVTAYIGDGVSVSGGTRTYTSQWQFYTASLTTTSAGGFYLYSFSDPTSGLYIWHPQLNYGSLRPYQPTTDRLNYPRITYQNGRGALLSEPQRTNLTQGSNGLTTNWTNYRGTYTANAIMSPDGTVNAPRTVWDGSSPNTVGFYFTNFSFAGSTRYCFSVFLKYYNKPVISVGYVDRSGPFLGGNAFFNIANGTFVSVDGDATTGIIEPYKDGWYRCTVVFTTTASPNFNYISVDSGTVVTGEGFYIYGSQLEVGEFPTTYIPTTSATVTRPNDQFFRNDSSALTTTDWTFYMSGVNIGKNQNSSGNNIDNVNWSFDSGGGPYGPNAIHNYNNTVYYYDTVNGAANLGDIGSTTTKFAVTKNGTTFKLFRNGVLFSTNVLSLASNVWDSFRMYGTTDAQGQAFSNNPSTLAILPSALSDANAQALTTVRSGSGGNISYYGPYTIHTFTGSATFTPSFNGQVEVLVVAGGGGGGSGFFKSACGGGGGAGGLQYVSSYGVSAGTGITVTVGAGGAGGPTGTGSPTGDGSNGSNSVFGGLTSIGGGGGTTYLDTNGKNGGSGGGAGGAGGFTPVGGQGIPGQGNNGGNQVGAGQSTDSTSCGGGGGAGAVGANGVTSQRGGNGGVGLPYSISGFSTYYAGGGGGGASLIGGGFGGLGGGANGGNIDSNGSSAVAYTGGGGGGASSGPGNTATGGGVGGAGIVIVRYLT